MSIQEKIERAAQLLRDVEVQLAQELKQGPGAVQARRLALKLGSVTAARAALETA